MASTISNSSLAQLDYKETPPSEYVAQIVIPEGRVRAPVTKTKPRIHLAKTHQPVARLFFDDDDTDYYDELPDLQIGYRRPELVNQTAAVHDDISDEVKLRLLLARKKALEAHKRNWG